MQFTAEAIDGMLSSTKGCLRLGLVTEDRSWGVHSPEENSPLEPPHREQLLPTDNECPWEPLLHWVETLCSCKVGGSTVALRWRFFFRRRFFARLVLELSHPEEDRPALLF